MKIENKAKEVGYRNFGKKIIFYHPGMFRLNGKWGKYPAISITGTQCELQCEHCKGKLLERMIHINSPTQLIAKCMELEKEGIIGCLLTGGSFNNGSIPWKKFIPAIKKIKEQTNLFISIHSGIIDENTAKSLKSAGVNQALIDIIGEESTLKSVFHSKFSIADIEKSLFALKKAKIDIIPHIVIGIDYGKIIGEYKALEIIKKYNPELLVFVILIPLIDTGMENVKPPPYDEVKDIVLKARIELPQIPISFGCARPYGYSNIAVECGLQRIVLPEDETIEKAKNLGLSIEWKETCCSYG